MNLNLQITAISKFTSLLVCGILALPPPKVRAEFRADIVHDTAGAVNLTFPTAKGYFYQIQTSSDCQTWSAAPAGAFYGNGEELSYFLLDPPAPAAADPGSSSGGAGSFFNKPYKIFWYTVYVNGQSSVLSSFQNTATWSIALPDVFPHAAGRLVSMSGENANFRYSMDVSVLNYGTQNLPTVPENQTWTPEMIEARDLLLAHKSELMGQLAYWEALGPQPPPPPLPGGGRVYYRVRREDIDTNHNGLPDWWEWQFHYASFSLPTEPGYADPAADDDNDGLTNAQQLAAGSDPSNPDTDADGIPDGADANPNAPQDPAVFAVATRTVVYTGASGGGSTTTSTTTTRGSHGNLQYERLWPVLANFSEAWYSPITADELGDLLEERYPFDPAPTAETPRNDGYSVEVSGAFFQGEPSLAIAPGTTTNTTTSTTPPPPGPTVQRSGNDLHSRVWLMRKFPAPYPESRTGIIITENKTTGNDFTEVSAEAATLTIPANAIISPFIDLRGVPPDGSGTLPNQAWRQRFEEVDLDVDANMNHEFFRDAGEDAGDERPYDLLGTGAYTSLEESEASVILRINNNNDSGPNIVDCEDDKLIGDKDLLELKSHLMGTSAPSELNFSGPKLKTKTYILKLVTGQEHVRVFDEKAPRERLVDKDHPQTLEALKFSPMVPGDKNLVKRERYIMEGVRAGNATIELWLAEAGHEGKEKPEDEETVFLAGAPKTLLDTVHVTVNVNRLPDPNAQMAGKSLARDGYRHRVVWTKELDAATLAEINNGVGGSTYQTPPIPSSPYGATARFLALRGTFELHLPRLPIEGRLYPTATWDTHGKSPFGSPQTTSYWVGLNDESNGFWIQWGVLLRREEDRPFKEQLPYIYLESGAQTSLGTKHIASLKEFRNTQTLRVEKTLEEKGVQLEFVLYKLSEGETVDKWNLLVRNYRGALPGTHDYDELVVGKADDGHPGDLTDALEKAFKEAKPRQIEIDSEFTQSVTAVAGFPDHPFRVSGLRAGLRRKAEGSPTAPPYSQRNGKDLWLWLEQQGYDWVPINAGTGKSNITVLTGEPGKAAVGNVPAVPPPAATVSAINTVDNLTLPEFPWHMKAKAAGPEDSMIEMWDERKWLFPAGTSREWAPGK